MLLTQPKPAPCRRPWLETAASTVKALESWSSPEQYPGWSEHGTSVLQAHKVWVVCTAPSSLMEAPDLWEFRSPPLYMPRKPSARAVFTRQSVLEAEARKGVSNHLLSFLGTPQMSLPSRSLPEEAKELSDPSQGPACCHISHRYLHSFIHIFPLLVLQSGLGKVNGKHAGHPHESCHTSIDEFCGDAGATGRREREVG